MDSHPERAGSPDLAGLAGLLADGTRAAICLALLDGRAWTAAELARHAGVAAPTATGHLNLLVAGGLLAQERLRPPGQRRGRDADREPGRDGPAPPGRPALAYHRQPAPGPGPGPHLL